MSENIFATAFTDPGLQAIRDQVSQKQDALPYLLLPLKIETRFMRVDRPLVEPDVFTEIVADLRALEKYMSFDPGKTPLHEVLGRFKKIADSVKTVAEKVSRLKKLDGNAREALIKQLNGLLKRNKELGAAIGRIIVPETKIIVQLRALRNTTEEGLQTMLAVISKLQPGAGTGDDFLLPLEAIVKALKEVAAQDLGTPDRKEKRQLFGFLNEQQAIITAGIKEMQLTIATNITAQESQLKRLDALTAQLQPLGKKAAANVRNLQSSYKSLEYSAQFDALVKNLVVLQQQIESRFRPKLQMMLETESMPARDLLIQVNELAAFLQKPLARPFAGYDEIIAHRKALYKKLSTLQAGTQKVLVGDEKEFSALQSRWDEVDAALEKFIQRVHAFKPADDTEKAALDSTITDLNTGLRKALAPLKSTAKDRVVRLNNSTLDKAMDTYHQVLSQVRELHEKITATPDKARELITEVEALAQRFLALAPHLVLLPQQAYRQLLKAAKALESTMSRLIKSASAAKIAPLDTAAAAAMDAAAQIRKAVEARMPAGLAPPATAPAARPPLVFATRTITRDELWVRIYPDDIAVHTHEEGLTQAEADSGKAYWLEILAAGGDADGKLAAWRAIAASYGSQRAAWIVRTMKPLKDNKPAREALLHASQTTLDVNKELEKLYRLLNQPVARATMFTLLGQAYPVLVNILEKLGPVQKENAALLLKTQQWLLKIQSLLHQMVQEVSGMPEPLRRQAAQGLQLLKEFLGSFNSLTQKFQSIGRLSSREIIRDRAPADIFPQVAIKDQAWTVPPHSRVMPHQLVVLTMRNGSYRHIQVSNPIPPHLVVGIHPSMMETGAFQYDADNNLIVDDTIKWLTDFNDAVSKGMALAITLDAEDVSQGFDKVLVLGVRDDTPEEAKKLLEDLLDNHHYLPEGASLLPVGTATNNTQTAASGYRKTEEDAAGSFAVERNKELPLQPVTDPGFPTDSARLAEGLGIDMAILQHLDYSDRTEISEAFTLNKALFAGTLANFMEEGLDSLFTRDNIRHTQAFFNRYVSARGFLPALRVGTQPYGILPVTAFSRFNATANDASLPVLTKEDFNNPASLQDELQLRYDIRLKQLLALLDALWTDIRSSKVLHAGNTDPEDPQAHFMGMLGLNAVSAELFYRYGVNVAARQGNEEVSINFNPEDPWSPVKVAEAFGSQVATGYYYLSDNFTDETTPFTDPLAYLNSKWNRINTQFSKARVFTMRHLQDQSQLLGDLIDNRELSETLAAAAAPHAGTPDEQFEARQQLPYYIDWLLDQNPWEVHAENKFSAPGPTGLSSGMPAKSLLFLLLRHAVLSAYADTMLKILEAEGLTDQKTIRKMGSPGFYYQRFAVSFTYVTKWTYLFSKIGRLDGVLDFRMNTANPFYVYMNSLAGTENGYLNRYLSPQSPQVFSNYANHAAHQHFVDELNETKAAIRKLKDIPTQRLERLLREHLDLCTYRLDAWRLGLVNKRLQENRQTHQTGLYLGAYGWVEALRKGGERLPAENIPPELWKTGDEPVFTDQDNLGFIHTPSLNHGVTAAILRAGFHANRATDEVDNLLAVNLSSGRVRTALNLINGMRSGQEPGALLGYQFERGLHERYTHIPLELDVYIYAFRDEFPLSLPVDENVALGEAALTQVVNGMELLETAQDFVESQGGPPHAGDSLYQSLKAFEAAWWSSLGNATISSATAAEKDALLREIDGMADAFDALGDLCVSESIYQVTRGNYVRSAAIMDKLAKGDVPVDIEFATTPRTGTVVTHKVALLTEVVTGIDQVLTSTGTNSTPLAGAALAAAVQAAGAALAEWNAPFSPRALAEPSLNKWAGQLIGNPANIKCLVEYTTDSVQAVTVTLASLGIQPLDALHLFGTGPLDGGAELNARVAAQVRKTVTLPADFMGTPDDLNLHIKYTERSPAWAAADYSFYEKAGYIQSIRELVTNSTALAADDLLLPGQEEVPEAGIRNLQPEELLTRMTNLRARLQLVYQAFSTFFSTEISLAGAGGHTFTFAQIDSLQALLHTAAAFGIPGTLPDTQVSYGDRIGMDLLLAADGAAKAMASRLSQAQADLVTGSDAALSPELRIKALAEAGRKILGREFVALPHFKLRNAADLIAQRNMPAAAGLLRSAPAFALDEWSQGIARVRHRMSILETIEMWAGNFGAPQPVKVPFQFPFPLATDGTAQDHWLGIAFPAGYAPQEDKLSLVLMNPAALTTAPEANKAGLLVDEWVEIIPHAAETTGITFNYDQPDAKPPNTLLLAVTPTPTGKWSWDDLAQTLNDTLEMAKNRAVEPEHLEDTVFGQLLPALLTEVVPPQLLPGNAENSGEAQNNPLGLQVVTDFGIVNDTYVPEEV